MLLRGFLAVVVALSAGTALASEESRLRAAAERGDANSQYELGML
jgi:hypothetical protein